MKLKHAGDTARTQYEELTTLRFLKESIGKVITLSEFEHQVDLDSFLEEGETIEGILMEDPDTYFYTFLHEDKVIYGFNSCGVDNLFSSDGTMPSLGGGLDSSLSEQCRGNQLAWVLAPCGSLLASGPMGKETELFRTDNFARFDGCNGTTRIQLLHRGEPVSGIQIKDNTVEALYTHSDYTGLGFASRLFDYAYKMFPELQHNTSLTKDGKAFVEKYESRRQALEASAGGFEP